MQKLKKNTLSEYAVLLAKSHKVYFNKIKNHATLNLYMEKAINKIGKNNNTKTKNTLRNYGKRVS